MIFPQVLIDYSKRMEDFMRQDRDFLWHCISWANEGNRELKSTLTKWKWKFSLKNTWSWELHYFGSQCSNKKLFTFFMTGNDELFQKFVSRNYRKQEGET